MSAVVPFLPQGGGSGPQSPQEVPSRFLHLRIDGSDHPLVCKLAAGYLELLVLGKAAAIVALWPTPQHLLDSKSPIVAVMVEHFAEAADAARHLARAAVHNGMKEAQALLPGLDARTAAEYADAILQRMERARGPRTGEVIDFTTTQLVSALTREDLPAK